MTTNLKPQVKTNTNKIHVINVTYDYIEKPVKDGSSTASFCGGDAILLESNGHFALIDTGEAGNQQEVDQSTVNYVSGKKTYDVTSCKVIPYIKRVLSEAGTNTLDFILGTHSHSDHISGIPKILNEFTVSKVYLRPYQNSYVNGKNNDKYLWYDNEHHQEEVRNACKDKIEVPPISIHFGDMLLEFFSRPYDEVAFDENLHSVVTKVTVNGHTAALMGDMQIDWENDIGSRIGKVDILKLGHHGIGNASHTSLLNIVQPSIMLNSGSRRASFSGTEASAWATDKNIPVYHTYESGFDAIVADLGGTEISVVYAGPGNCGLVGSDIVGTDRTRQLIMNQWNEKLAKGTVYKGWLARNNGVDWYFFNHTTGYMAIGWAQDPTKYGNTWFYFDANGLMHTGWIDLPDGLYYCNSSGAMMTGWVQIGEHCYYFDSNNGGRMATGWVNPQGTNYYYTKPTGVKAADLGMRLEGWQNIDGQVYYLDPSQDGKMLYRWQQIGGGWYYFGNNGMMQTGWINPQNYDFYYLQPTGTMGNDLGRMLTGFHFIEGYWYYLDPNDGGRMAINCDRMINGKLYHFDPSGHCTNY